MNGQPIEVYVELAGKEKYHSTLRGRDDENQHSISAITNLQDNLDTLQESIDQNQENIENLSESSTEKFNQLTLNLSELRVTLTNQINSIQSDLEDEIEETKNEITSETDEKVQQVKDFINEELSHIDLEAYYTKDETDEKLEGTFHYKGQVTEFDALPVVQNEKGDVYNVSTTGANYVWTGYAWDNLSPTICLKGYATKDYVDGTLEASIRLLQDHLHVHYYEKEEIDQKINEIIDIGPEMLATVFIFKGAVDRVDLLPSEHNKIGDVYVVLENKSKWFWAGVAWEKLADDLIDKIYTKEEILNLLDELKSEVEQEIQDLSSEIEILQTAMEQKNQEIADLNNQISDINQTRVWHEIE